MSRFIDHIDSLASLAQEEGSGGGSMDLWVPGEEVSVYEVEMPDVPQRKWIDMVPWLLEDQLLRSSEELHFVIGPVLGNNRVLVYVIAQESMNHWLMMAESKAVSAQKFTPDYLALPIENDYWTMSIQGSRMLVRTGSYTGFAAEVNLGWQLLEIELERADGARIAAIVDVDDEGAIPSHWQDRVSAQRGEINWGFIDQPDVNLLSGDYRPQKATELGPWLPSIGLAACAMLLALCFMLVQSYQWKQDLLVIDTGISAAYEDLFSETWKGPRSEIRNAAEERIKLLEHQFIALQTTPLYELRSMDAGLSACPECDVQLIKQDQEALSLTMKPTDSLKSRLNTLSGVDIQWGTPNEEGILSLKVSKEANDG